MVRKSLLVSVLGTGLVLLASAARAQSGFTGVVKDSTGAVLPGVVVEASSPALIEKMRTAVTDASGAYRIIDLRPGIYSISFTLQGFSVVRRDGISLPAEFTATINAELRLGELQETITVTGNSPLVDTTNVIQQNTIKGDLVDLLPASNRSPQAMALLTPGVTVALGALPGSFNELFVAVNGGRTADQQIRINGDAVVRTGGVGAGSQNMRWNEAYVQEMTVRTGAAGADQETAGMVSNIIPKEGGNDFSGSMNLTYTNERFANSNLEGSGITAVNRVINLYDFTPGFGGPLKRDKVWFFVSARAFKSTNAIANLYETLDPKAWVYTPNLARPAKDSVRIPDYNGRVTWQVSQINKFAVFVEDSGYGQTARLGSSTNALEAAQVSSTDPNTFAQFNWKSTLSSKLLLDANFSTYYSTQRFDPAGGSDITSVSAVEQTTGMRLRAPSLLWGANATKNFTPRVSTTYVTGSHNVQTGFTWTFGTNSETRFNAGGYEIRVNRGVGNQITEFASPTRTDSDLNAQLALYGQDQWRLTSKLTLSYGLRFDKLVGEILPLNLPQGDIVGPRSFPGVKNAPNFTDINPRVGAAYDLFGNGRTAVKGFIGRYVVGSSIAQNLAPISRSITSVTRTWTDKNNDHIPDCDLRNPLANSGVDDCGQISNLNFGQNNPNATQFGPKVNEGFGTRAYNWYGSAEIQQQLTKTSSISFGYVRRWYGNFTVTDNLALTPADFDPFCVKAPVDSRLPGGGGYDVCGLYDVKIEKAGQGILNTVRASDFGEQSEIYNGVNLNANVRYKGVGVNGGVNIGRTVTDNCFVVDSPQRLLQCRTKPPRQPNSRLLMSYTVPVVDVQVSSALLVNPPPQITASYTASAAEVIGLGRRLAAGATATVNVPLIAPGTAYGEYAKQLDLRVTKRWRIAGQGCRIGVDVFNVFNSNTAQSQNNTFGTAWLQPTNVLLGRYAQFNAQWDF